jgi:hypothetical protein
MEKRHRAPIVPGLLLILVGLWFLGRQLDLPLFVGNVIWPWLLVAVGAIIWVRYIVVSPRSADDVFWGTGTILAGAFLLAWQNNIILSDVRGWDKLWPIIPLIMGIAGLVQWIFDIRNWGTLIFALMFGTVGVAGLGYTLGSIDFMTAWSFGRFWPILLIIAGVGIMIQAVSRRNRHMDQ